MSSALGLFAGVVGAILAAFSAGLLVIAQTGAVADEDRAGPLTDAGTALGSG